MKVKFLWDKDGPALLSPTVFKDKRGYFFESFNDKDFKEQVADVTFVQDNESKSEYGTIRGLHFQKPPFDQAKLVRVVKGAVYDVAVDIRKGSPTYGEYCGAYLSEKNHRQFFIPRGFAHGFVALEDNTVFQYKCDNFYDKESEGAIHWNDPELNIQWWQWVDFNSTIISEKDESNLYLSEIESPFIYNKKEENE